MVSFGFFLMTDRVQALFALIIFYELAEYIQLHYPTNTWFPSDGLEAFLWVLEISLIWFILSKVPPNPRPFRRRVARRDAGGRET